MILCDKSHVISSVVILDLRLAVTGRFLSELWCSVFGLWLLITSDFSNNKEVKNVRDPQYYLLPDRDDFSIFTTAEARTRFRYPRRMQGWVYLGHIGKIVYPPKNGHLCQKLPGSVMAESRTHDHESRVWLPKHYTIKSPKVRVSMFHCHEPKTLQITAVMYVCPVMFVVHFWTSCQDVQQCYTGSRIYLAVNVLFRLD